MARPRSVQARVIRLLVEHPEKSFSVSDLLMEVTEYNENQIRAGLTALTCSEEVLRDGKRVVVLPDGSSKRRQFYRAAPEVVARYGNHQELCEALGVDAQKLSTAPFEASPACGTYFMFQQAMVGGTRFAELRNRLYGTGSAACREQQPGIKMPPGSPEMHDTPPGGHGPHEYAFDPLAGAHVAAAARKAAKDSQVPACTAAVNPLRGTGNARHATAVQRTSFERRHMRRLTDSLRDKRGDWQSRAGAMRRRVTITTAQRNTGLTHRPARCRAIQNRGAADRRPSVQGMEWSSGRIAGTAGRAHWRGTVRFPLGQASPFYLRRDDSRSGHLHAGFGPPCAFPHARPKPVTPLDVLRSKPCVQEPVRLAARRHRVEPMDGPCALHFLRRRSQPGGCMPVERDSVPEALRHVPEARPFGRAYRGWRQDLGPPGLVLLERATGLNHPGLATAHSRDARRCVPRPLTDHQHHPPDQLLVAQLDAG